MKKNKLDFNEIMKRGQEKTEELKNTKFRGAALLIGVKNKLVGEIKDVKMFPTEYDGTSGSKKLSFDYNDKNIIIEYLIYDNKESINIITNNDHDNKILLNQLNIISLKAVEEIINLLKIS